MIEQPISKKPLFNLSLVVQETGIKPDTLRAWERRYDLPAPSRTEGGHRLFSQYDIETIKWLLARQAEGMRISQAVDYWRELHAAGRNPLAGNQQLTAPASAAASPTPASSALTAKSLAELKDLWIERCLAYQEEQAELVLDSAFTHYPWESVLTDLIFSGMSEIGEGWYSGRITVQQEHYASELVTRKLQALIDGAPQPYHPQKALIASPAGEHHAIPSLALNLLLRYRGWEIIYLGADVPLPDLEASLSSIHPSLTIMTAARLETAAAILDASQTLRDHDIPLAYSGVAFAGNPQLSEKIPGTYLGDDLGRAVVIIESLLSEPNPSADPAPTTANPYQGLSDELSQNLPYLESAVLLDGSADWKRQVPAEILREFNEFFFNDLAAALKLGDIQLLDSNITWAKGLLASRSIDPAVLNSYLESIRAVIRKEFGPEAAPLLEWLIKYQKETAGE